MVRFGFDENGAERIGGEDSLSVHRLHERLHQNSGGNLYLALSGGGDDPGEGRRRPELPDLSPERRDRTHSVPPPFKGLDLGPKLGDLFLFPLPLFTIQDEPLS